MCVDLEEVGRGFGKYLKLWMTELSSRKDLTARRWPLLVTE
jgi:hypothetical protein